MSPTVALGLRDRTSRIDWVSLSSSLYQQCICENLSFSLTPPLIRVPSSSSSCCPLGSLVCGAVLRDRWLQCYCPLYLTIGCSLCACVLHCVVLHLARQRCGVGVLVALYRLSLLVPRSHRGARREPHSVCCVSAHCEDKEKL